MKRIFYVVAVIVFGCVVQAFAAEPYRIPEADNVLSTLSKPHPRLLLGDDGLARLQELRKSDPLLEKYIVDVIKQADEFCTEPTLSYKVREGYRIMSVSRQCMDRMYTLGMAWRLTGDNRYARKAEDDLLAVCALENWTPSLAIIYPLQQKHKDNEKKHGVASWSFLDVSEMTHGVGIGYDWFYHYLSEDSREKIKSGLITHGLELGIAAYTGKGKAAGQKDEWTTYDHNWNLVCNGGLIVGALAIAESDPEYARVIVPSSVESLPIAMTTYGPDGAWPEGPSYWGYATRYAVFGLAAFDSALGTDFGLSDIPGLAETGLFPLYSTGPTGMYLNFADSGEKNKRVSISCLFWLAGRYNNSFLSDREHEMIAKHGADPLHLVWYQPPSGAASPKLALDQRFRGNTEVALFRSSWGDPDALFAGVKAGDNTFNHAQLDLGTFEVDALGVRWARDLGKDDYSLPGYFDFYYLTGKLDGQRWNYYRNNSLSHNIPLIDGRGQDELAKARFTSFSSNAESGHVLVDLSEAYAYGTKRAERGLSITGGRRAIFVQDEFELSGENEIAWGMTTDADIALDGGTATLSQDGKNLTARILSPEGAVFSVESSEQEPPQETNEGVKRLMIRLGKRAGNVRISVLLSPHWEDGNIVKDAEVKPLREW